MPCPSSTIRQTDLHIYQGDDWAGVLNVWQADGVTPADITGYTAKAQLRREVADVDAAVACEITCVVESPRVLLSIHHDLTIGLSARYVWDCELTSPAGAITTVAWGHGIVTQEVTRPAPVVPLNHDDVPLFVARLAS